MSRNWPQPWRPERVRQALQSTSSASRKTAPPGSGQSRALQARPDRPPLPRSRIWPTTTQSSSGGPTRCRPDVLADDRVSRPSRRPLGEGRAQRQGGLGLHLDRQPATGGQEMNLFSTITNLLHFGMVVVGLPYSFAGLTELGEITGGTPYGATTIAGLDGSRQPSENELEGARYQAAMWPRLPTNSSARPGND